MREEYVNDYTSERLWKELPASYKAATSPLKRLSLREYTKQSYAAESSRKIDPPPTNTLRSLLLENQELRERNDLLSESFSQTKQTVDELKRSNIHEKHREFREQLAQMKRNDAYDEGQRSLIYERDSIRESETRIRGRARELEDELDVLKQSLQLHHSTNSSTNVATNTSRSQRHHDDEDRGLDALDITTENISRNMSGMKSPTTPKRSVRFSDQTGVDIEAGMMQVPSSTPRKPTTTTFQDVPAAQPTSGGNYNRDIDRNNKLDNDHNAETKSATRSKYNNNYNNNINNNNSDNNTNDDDNNKNDTNNNHNNNDNNNHNNNNNNNNNADDQQQVDPFTPPVTRRHHRANQTIDSPNPPDELLISDLDQVNDSWLHSKIEAAQYNTPLRAAESIRNRDDSYLDRPQQPMIPPEPSLAIRIANKRQRVLTKRQSLMEKIEALHFDLQSHEPRERSYFKLIKHVTDGELMIPGAAAGLLSLERARAQLEQEAVLRARNRTLMAAAQQVIESQLVDFNEELLELRSLESQKGLPDSTSSYEIPPQKLVFMQNSCTEVEQLDTSEQVPSPERHEGGSPVFRGPTDTQILIQSSRKLRHDVDFICRTPRHQQHTDTSNNSSSNNNSNNDSNNNNNNNNNLNTNTTNDNYDINNHHHYHNNTNNTNTNNNNKVGDLRYALTPTKTNTATMSPNLAKTGTQLVAVSPLVASARLMNSKVLAMSQGFDVRSDLATSLRTMKNSVRDVEEAASHDLSMINTNHHDHDRDRKSVRWLTDEQTPRVSNNLGASKLELSDLIQRSPQTYNNAPTIAIEDSFYTSRDLDQQRDRDFYREIIDRSDRLSLSPSAQSPRKGLMTINNNNNRNSYTNNSNSSFNNNINNNNNNNSYLNNNTTNSDNHNHNTNKGIMKSSSLIPTPTPITTTTTTHKLEGVSASLSTLKAKAQRLLNSLSESEPPKKKSQRDQA